MLFINIFTKSIYSVKKDVYIKENVSTSALNKVRIFSLFQLSTGFRKHTLYWKSKTYFTLDLYDLFIMKYSWMGNMDLKYPSESLRQLILNLGNFWKYGIILLHLLLQYIRDKIFKVRGELSGLIRGRAVCCYKVFL